MPRRSWQGLGSDRAKAFSLPVPRTMGRPAGLEMPAKERRTDTCPDQFSATFPDIL